MSVLRRILDRYRGVMTIHAVEGEVVFRRVDDEARSEPLIRYAENGKIMDIGKAAESGETGRLVRLFDSEGGSDDSALRAFCRYHFMLTEDMTSFQLRPRVMIAEPSLRRAFGRNAATALLRVLRADGFKAEIVDAT